MDANTIQLIHDVLIAVADVVLPVLIAYGFKLYSSHTKTAQQYEKDKDLANSINTAIKDSVVIAQKAGVIDNLTGSEKFNKAMSYVKGVINSLGITDYDETQLKAKIEVAYAEGKKQLEAAYTTTTTTTTKQPKETTTTTTTAKPLSPEEQKLQDTLEAVTKSVKAYLSDTSTSTTTQKVDFNKTIDDAIKATTTTTTGTANVAPKTTTTSTTVQSADKS